MAKLNIAPTKSNLLSLKRQLAFAEEGYDLLEQKRQILIYELMSRLNPAQEAERKAAEALKLAFLALSEAQLDIGTEALERAITGVHMDHQVTISDQRMMGIRLPSATLESQPFAVQFGVAGTSASTDLALRRFLECLPTLARLAQVGTAVLRLARDLRKTQRRCNALSKIFIPDQRETIAYIMGALEEREREAFIILKMIRDRQAHRA